MTGQHNDHNLAAVLGLLLGVGALFAFADLMQSLWVGM